MATIAAATASAVSDAEYGFMRPGQMQNTARAPAGKGLTGTGLRVSEKADKYGRFLISCTCALRIMCAAQNQLSNWLRLVPVASCLLFPREDPSLTGNQSQLRAVGVNCWQGGLTSLHVIKLARALILLPIYRAVKDRPCYS